MSDTTYDIWCEGYQATGEYSPARCVARNVVADSFAEACQKYAFEEGVNYLFDAEALSVWGMRLFDNECDARKLLG